VGVPITWDPAKNDVNAQKHGVSFEGAQELLPSGDDYLEVFDDVHSDAEDRFIAIGPITRGLVLVAWTEREEEVVRIIGARLATPTERALFIAYRGGHS
jgi:uncharacterized DUF497 family protein